MSILVLIDFIAILLTPGTFLIQIVNTNMYLIHFYSKNNIKMHFPKSWDFKLQLYTSHSLLRDEINCVGSRKAFSMELHSQIFKNEQFKYINFTYNVIFYVFLKKKLFG